MAIHLVSETVGKSDGISSKTGKRKKYFQIRCGGTIFVLLLMQSSGYGLPEVIVYSITALILEIKTNLWLKNQTRRRMKNTKTFPIRSTAGNHRAIGLPPIN